jgi:hypothetical protein
MRQTAASYKLDPVALASKQRSSRRGCRLAARATGRGRQAGLCHGRACRGSSCAGHARAASSAGAVVEQALARLAQEALCTWRETFRRRRRRDVRGCDTGAGRRPAERGPRDCAGRAVVLCHPCTARRSPSRSSRATSAPRTSSPKLYLNWTPDSERATWPENRLPAFRVALVSHRSRWRGSR